MTPPAPHDAHVRPARIHVRLQPAPAHRIRMPRGFTLLETLLVLGVIALLLAITLPTLRGVSRAADRARTLAWFNDWAAAMELFRQEYGYYPHLAEDGGPSGKIDPDRFLAALTGRDRHGAPVTVPGSAGNRRGLSFLALPAAALDAASGELLDGCGNGDVVVLVDANQDGLINGTELVRPSMRRGSITLGHVPAGELPGDVFPADGLRAGVAFYSAGGHDWIASWE